MIKCFVFWYILPNAYLEDQLSQRFFPKKISSNPNGENIYDCSSFPRVLFFAEINHVFFWSTKLIMAVSQNLRDGKFRLGFSNTSLGFPGCTRSTTINVQESLYPHPVKKKKGLNQESAANYSQFSNVVTSQQTCAMLATGTGKMGWHCFCVGSGNDINNPLLPLPCTLPH